MKKIKEILTHVLGGYSIDFSNDQSSEDLAVLMRKTLDMEKRLNEDHKILSKYLLRG